MILVCVDCNKPMTRWNTIQKRDGNCFPRCGKCYLKKKADERKERGES